MYLVLLAAAIAILVGVVVVAMGRGGEIAPGYRDVPVRLPRIRSAADLAMLRLPVGLLGYQQQAADAALDAAARLIAEQEAEIARLRAQARLLSRRGAGAEARGTFDARPGAAGTGAAETLPAAGSPAAGSPAAGSPAAGDEVLSSPDPSGGQA